MLHGKPQSSGMLTKLTLSTRNKTCLISASVADAPGRTFIRPPLSFPPPYRTFA